MAKESGSLIGILIAVVVVVGIVAGADLLLSFAVVRRLAALESFVRSGGSQTSPAVGQKVGDFEVELLTGGVFTLADLKDEGALVVFLSLNCEACQRAISELRELPTPLSRPLYVLINGADAGQDNAVLEVAADLPSGTRVAEISATHPVMEAFGVDGWPSVLGIEDGIIRASDFRVSRVLETAHR
jgi:AhpC/TSA family